MSQAKSFGIVIFGIGPDELAIYFVDELLWGQIATIEKADLGTFDDMREWAMYLAEGHSDRLVKPEGCPVRQGAVLKTVFCQAFVTEHFSEMQGTALGIAHFQM